MLIQFQLLWLSVNQRHLEWMLCWPRLERGMYVCRCSLIKAGDCQQPLYCTISVKFKVSTNLFSSLFSFPHAMFRVHISSLSMFIKANHMQIDALVCAKILTELNLKSALTNCNSKILQLTLRTFPMYNAIYNILYANTINCHTSVIRRVIPLW